MIEFPFLDFPATDDEGSSARYTVLPVPYERTVSYGGGTAGGPEAILKASTQVEMLDEELGVEPAHRIQTLTPVAFEGLEEGAAMAAIRDAAAAASGTDCFLLALGGEHSITGPLVAAARDVHGDFTVLQFDAHADLREEYEGSRHSHAAVMSRVRELDVPTVGVGIRSLSAAEHQRIQDEHVPILRARNIVEDDSRAWIDDVLDQLGDNVYVTFDIDCFDPSLVPGTGTPEPGGMGWYDVIACLRRVFAERNVIAADIVEVAPIPGMHVSEFVAARLAAKMVMYHQVLGYEKNG